MTELIYIPGLSDHTTFWQPAALSGWRTYGLKVQYHPVGWADGEAFAAKLKRLLEQIDEIKQRGSNVALVGVSAGASAAINAYVRRRSKIDSLVYICGKIQNPQTVSAATYEHNPAFKQSMALLAESLRRLTKADRRKLLNVHPLRDGTVPVQDTKIPGVKEKILPTSGHFQSIAFAITFGSVAIARFIKKPG